MTIFDSLSKEVAPMAQVRALLGMLSENQKTGGSRRQATILDRPSRAETVGRMYLGSGRVNRSIEGSSANGKGVNVWSQ